MLTDQFYVQLAGLIKGGLQGWSPLYIAVGGGDAQWDTRISTPDRSTLVLTDEILRKPVAPDAIVYLDEEGEAASGPGAVIRLQARFDAGEATGTLRECGLFAGSDSDQINTGVLLAYFIHPRIEKTADMALNRSIVLNLSPQKTILQGHLSSYLGNVISEELHNLENEKPGCQIDEIRSDRRAYFSSPEQAIGVGYDYCAFCFGKELSRR